MERNTHLNLYINYLQNCKLSAEVILKVFQVSITSRKIVFIKSSEILLQKELTG